MVPTSCRLPGQKVWIRTCQLRFTSEIWTSTSVTRGSTICSARLARLPLFGFAGTWPARTTATLRMVSVINLWYPRLCFLCCGNSCFKLYAVTTGNSWILKFRLKFASFPMEWVESASKVHWGGPFPVTSLVRHPHCRNSSVFVLRKCLKIGAVLLYWTDYFDCFIFDLNVYNVLLASSICSVKQCFMLACWLMSVNSMLQRQGHWIRWILLPSMESPSASCIYTGIQVSLRVGSLIFLSRYFWIFFCSGCFLIISRTLILLLFLLWLVRLRFCTLFFILPI